MGCNAGLFLLLAEEKGFGRVVGVDSNETAVRRGEAYRDKLGMHYQFRLSKMEAVIDTLPLADYTVLANAHYYFTINDWLDYLDKLQYKTRYCIIVTAEKRSKQRCWASADVPDIRTYFKTWKEVGFVDQLPLEGDPMPRRLWGLCFESPHLEKFPVDALDSGNHVQDQFYSQLDEGINYVDTRYYHILKKYRERWGERRLNRWFEERMAVYADIKLNGQIRPIYVGEGDRILDGNHKHAMLRTLGFKNVFIRRT
jgi:hypothetical protein